MAKRTKRYLDLKQKVDREKLYSLEEAIALVKEAGSAKFDETVEVSMRLGVDPRKADQMVRGTVLLPNGTGKELKVLVFAKGEKETEAKEAGADFVGAEDIVEKIQGGWIDFDKAVATPDLMGMVGKVAKILGPRGLMPNPKVGTVTLNVKDAVQELKKGKVEFRVDKGANLHIPVGKVSFDTQKLADNVTALVDSVFRLKPPASKGQYVKNMFISSTMGPSVKLDVAVMR